MAANDPLDEPWLSTDDWCSFHNSVSEVMFNDAEFGPNRSVRIQQVEEDKLSFFFYIDIDVPIEI